MDVKINVCEKTEWDPNFLDRIPMTDGELKEIEAKLIDDLDVTDDYSLFLYGQFLYEKGDYEKAFHYFEIMANRGNFQSKYQAAMMCYDGLGTEINMNLGFKMMNDIALSTDPEASHLRQAAALNVGRAYFYGFGVPRSEELAEKFWKLAAEGEQETESCTQAQTILGLFYTLPDHRNLDLAFHYHSLAGEKGSLESQGSLAVMYLNGMGVKRSEEKGYKLLKKASSKGSIYAKGNMVKYYYHRKLFTKAAELATEVVDVTDIDKISKETECLIPFIKMGISIACFYYGRCLTFGRGVAKDECLAQTYYKKSFENDKKICNELHKLVLHGVI